MGMFDYLYASLKCPYCGSITTINEQIKWRPYGHRELKTFEVGDEIPSVEDGIYTKASGARDLIGFCAKCGNKYSYSVSVRNGIIHNISAKQIGDKNDS